MTLNDRDPRTDLFSPQQVERMTHQPRLVAAGAWRVAEHLATFALRPLPDAGRWILTAQ